MVPFALTLLFYPWLKVGYFVIAFILSSFRASLEYKNGQTKKKWENRGGRK